MASKEVALGFMLLLQTTAGIWGNYFLLCYYIILSCNKCHLRSKDLILKHLSIANSLVILANGVPQTMTAFGMKHFLNDLGCKLISYIQRVGRSASIGIICLLSIFQNIMVSPRNSCWRNLKGNTPKYIGFSISLCWIFHMMLNSIFCLYMLGKLGSENITEKTDYGYCYTAGRDRIIELLYATLFVCPEVVISVLMVWSSGSMILILYRHKQRVRHIHSTKVSPRSCPASRATQRILVLVCTFVAFHTLSSLLNAYIALSSTLNWWLFRTNTIISMCFPTVSPFLLMIHDFTVSKECLNSVQKKIPLS